MARITRWSRGLGAWAVLAGGLGIGGCARPPEAVSLLGTPLYPMELAPDVRADREARLAAARRDYEADPDDEAAIIWLGRRTAYLGRYREAIAIYTEGLQRHPRSHKLLRHRGHRFITVRELDDAIADLERARRIVEGDPPVPDEVEPDGLPNRLNRPTSTSHGNIDYHLGLARYLRGEWAEALAAYRSGLDRATNDDMRCAATYWVYLALRRLGRGDGAAAALAPITADMEIIENVAYHRLLLLYKGELTPDDVLGREADAADAIEDATVAYGLGAWWWLEGDEDRAVAVWRDLVAGPTWPAFGHIAAEAEIARRPR